MSRNHSLGKFSSTANTMRIESPEIGGLPPRPSFRQRTQIALRLCATTLGLLAMALFAASISYTNAHFKNVLGGGDWTDGLALAPSLLALVINPLFLLRSKMASATTPALRVAADFVIWGLAIPSIIYAVAGGMFWSWSDAIPEANGTIDCNFWYNGLSRECAPVAYQIGRMQIAAAVFLALLCLTHLVLCITGVAELVSKKDQRQNAMQPSFDMNINTKDVESRPETSA